MRTPIRGLVWVMVLVIVLSSTLFSDTQSPRGFWTKASIRSYYPLSADNAIRNGQTIYGGNLFKAGIAANHKYPKGTIIYVEVLKKWLEVDDKIPCMKDDTLYVRILNEDNVMLMNSRIYVVFPKEVTP